MTAKISIAMPFHLRGMPYNKSYEIAIRYYSLLGYPLHLCGSEGELSKKFCKPFLSKRTKYFEVPQISVCQKSKGDEVIRKKFNDALSTVRTSDWDCLLGADDLASRSFFTELGNINVSTPVMAGINMKEPIYMIDLTRKANNIWRISIDYGQRMDLLPGVNAFSSQVMLESNGNMYNEEGCETGAERWMRKNGTVLPLKGSVILLKGDTVLNSVNAILGRHKSLHMTNDEIETIRSIVGYYK